MWLLFVNKDMCGKSPNAKIQGPGGEERHRLLNSKRLQVKHRSETLSPRPVPLEFIVYARHGRDLMG